MQLVQACSMFVQSLWELHALFSEGVYKPLVSPRAYILLRRRGHGLIYSFGEEGMQLVQPSKFFSVTIFRTRFYRQYWHARGRTVAMLLFLVTLKNFDVCTVTMGVACPLLRRSI